MKSVGQSKTGNRVSDTLMLGSRKETVNDRQITVTFLYSRSGNETWRQKLKLFFFGDSLEKNAKQKIVQLLKKNLPENEAIKEFLQQIQNSRSGVSASDFIEIVTQEKLIGVDLLDEIKIMDQKEAFIGTKEISKDYLLKKIKDLWGSQPGISPEKMTELLLQSPNEQSIELTSREKGDLTCFRDILLNPKQSAVSKEMSKQIAQRIDQLLKENLKKPTQSIQAPPKVSKDSLPKEIQELVTPLMSEESIEQLAELLLELDNFQASINECNDLQGQIDALEKLVKKQKALIQTSDKSPALIEKQKKLALKIGTPENSRAKLDHLKSKKKLADLKVPAQDKIIALKNFRNILLLQDNRSESLENISQRIERLLDASGQSTGPWALHNGPRQKSTASDGTFFNVSLGDLDN